MRHVIFSVMEYFAALGLEPQLSIDLADLERRFYLRSRELHPDRFARAPKEEQQRALDQSSLLNVAYRSLKNPLTRADYLLRQHGVDSKEMPPGVLEQMFELNMMREEGEDVSEQLESMLAEVDSTLPDYFTRWDQSRDPEILREIRAQLNRRRYIENLIHPHV